LITNTLSAASKFIWAGIHPAQNPNGLKKNLYPYVPPEEPAIGGGERNKKGGGNIYRFLTTLMVKRMASVFMRGSAFYLPSYRIPRMHNFELLSLNSKLETSNAFDFIEPLNL
jgi:hypothetical protein